MSVPVDQFIVWISVIYQVYLVIKTRVCVDMIFLMSGRDPYTTGEDGGEEKSVKSVEFFT